MDRETGLRAVIPLRLVLIGGLIVLIDHDTQINNSFELDFFNDTFGALLIGIGTFLIGKVPVSPRYSLTMGAARVGTVVLIAASLYPFYVQFLPIGSEVADLFLTLLLGGWAAVFCTAMKWFCDKARLVRAAASWRVTVILMVGCAVAISLLCLATPRLTHLWVSGEPDAGLLLIPLWLLRATLSLAPPIHFAVSTYRTRRGLEAGRSLRTILNRQKQG